MNEQNPEPNVGSGGLLAMSIITLIICGIATPFVWISSNKAIKTLEDAGFNSGSQYGQARAAQIISIVGMCLWILGMIARTQLRNR
jgi:hypothetical protein